MMLQEVIISLLQRLGHGQQGDTISFDEVRRWAPNTLSILLEEKFIEPANPAKTIVCTGCPENCFKPVHTLPGQPGNPPRHFIACDETDYMGKIAVRSEQLQQWQISTKQVANWVAKELRLRTPSSHAKVPGELAIGLLLNDKYRCQVALNSVDVLSLKINQVSIPLVDVLYVDDEQLAIDLVAIESLAKQSVLVSSKSEYQPSTVRRDVRKLDTQNMYADWQKAYRQLLKKSPGMSDVWYSQQLAKKPIAKSRDANTIRRHMKG